MNHNKGLCPEPLFKSSILRVLTVKKRRGIRGGVNLFGAFKNGLKEWN